MMNLASPRQPSDKCVAIVDTESQINAKTEDSVEIFLCQLPMRIRRLDDFIRVVELASGLSLSLFTVVYCKVTASGFLATTILSPSDRDVPLITIFEYLLLICDDSPSLRQTWLEHIRFDPAPTITKLRSELEQFLSESLLGSYTLWILRDFKNISFVDLRMWLEAGLPIETTENLLGRSLLTIVVKNYIWGARLGDDVKMSNSMSILTYLLERGASLLAQDSEHRNPIHHAVIDFSRYSREMHLSAAAVKDFHFNFTYLLLRLIDQDAKPKPHSTFSYLNRTVTRALDAIDLYKKNVLVYAASSTSEKIVGILLDKNVSPTNKDTLGATPLHVAAVNPNILILKRIAVRILANGESIDPVTSTKQTPAHYAALYEMPANYYYLMSIGANPSKHSDVRPYLTSASTPGEYAKSNNLSRLYGSGRLPIDDSD